MSSCHHSALTYSDSSYVPDHPANYCWNDPLSYITVCHLHKSDETVHAAE